MSGKTRERAAQGFDERAYRDDAALKAAYRQAVLSEIDRERTAREKARSAAENAAHEKRKI